MESSSSENGCDGVEVITAHSSKEEINLVSKWAEESALLASVGSDYHGWPNQRVQIGHLQNLPNSNQAIWRDW